MAMSNGTMFQLLLVFQSHLGPYAARLFTAIVPAEVLTDWHGKVSYSGGRNKAAVPRNFERELQSTSLKVY